MAALERGAVAACLAAGLAFPLSLGAQTIPGGGSPQDSSAVREELEEAQTDFERERVRHLPWTRSRRPSPCDEIVGRFCFWHEDGSGWTPAPEDPEIMGARERLVERLAEAARMLPGDGWIAGQRVRYLVEAGQYAQAAAVAGACRAEPWWCRALEGYARHAAGQYAAAEGSFDAALAAMPVEERDRWNDLELLLDRDLRRAWKPLGRGARGAFARRLWWLADPFWSVAGNERRTEHFARLVIDRALDRARTPYGIAWGRDLHELTIRYGWPIGWERVRQDLSRLGTGGPPSIVGHDAAGGRPFLPPHDAFVSPFDARPEDWRLDLPSPRSTYAPSYADSVVDLAHQLAVFRRGDKAIVVAGYDIDRSQGPADDALDGAGEAGAALAIAVDPDAGPEIARGTGASGAIRLEVPWRAAVVSVEARAGRRAARARYGLPLPAHPTLLSDLLLLAKPAPLPGTLDDAAPLARRSNVVRSGERVAFLFEIYPPSPTDDQARIGLTLRDQRGGFWRGLGALLGTAPVRIGGVALAWSEEIRPGTAIHPRALVVELPELPEGEYVLELEVVFPGGRGDRKERWIEVR